MTLEKFPAADNTLSTLNLSIGAERPTSFDISISHMEDRTLVVLVGELDDATVPLLHNALLDVVGVKDALKAGMEIPDDAELEMELTGPQYEFSSQQQVQLEKKDDMKKLKDENIRSHM